MISGFHATVAAFVAFAIALSLYAVGEPLLLAGVCWFTLSWFINDLLDDRLKQSK
jgi:hypothetical protein